MLCKENVDMAMIIKHSRAGNSWPPDMLGSAAGWETQIGNILTLVWWRETEKRGLGLTLRKDG